MHRPLLFALLDPRIPEYISKGFGILYATLGHVNGLLFLADISKFYAPQKSEKDMKCQSRVVLDLSCLLSNCRH